MHKAAHRVYMPVHGFYFDPRHGGAMRRVLPATAGFRILGVYGTGEMRPAGEPWAADVRVARRRLNGDVEMEVVFHKEKPDPRNLTMRAIYVRKAGSIDWKDGNRWLPMHVHRAQLVAPPSAAPLFRQCETRR